MKVTRNITIILPVPDRAISPNAKRGQSKWAAIKKSKLVKQHRDAACVAMKAIISRVAPFFGATGYSLDHYFKTAAIRDEDNADGACKAYRDGICDALGIDDKNFCKLKLSTRQKDAKNPRVEITVYFDESP